jgi:hypothetical protein
MADLDVRVIDDDGFMIRHLELEPLGELPGQFPDYLLRVHVSQKSRDITHVEVMRLCSNPSWAADLENCGSKVRTMAELGLFGVSRGVGRGSDGTTFEPRPERRCGAHFLASKG